MADEPYYLEPAIFGLPSPGDVRARKNAAQVYVVDLLSVRESVPAAMAAALTSWASSVWAPFFAASDSLLTAFDSMARLRNYYEPQILQFQQQFSAYVTLGMPAIDASPLMKAPPTPIDKIIGGVGDVASTIKWIAVAGAVALVGVAIAVAWNATSTAKGASEALIRRAT